MREHRPVGRVEDYTVPFLVSAGVALFCALFAVVLLWGWLAMAALSLALDRLLRRLAPRQP